MQSPYIAGDVSAPMPWWVWALVAIVWIAGTIGVYLWLCRRSRRHLG